MRLGVNHLFKWIWRNRLLVGTLALLIISIPRLVTGIYASNRLYETDESPSRRVAIVFGAGLGRDGTPTAILRDRVETAACMPVARLKRSS
jgi:SanA protein